MTAKLLVGDAWPHSSNIGSQEQNPGSPKEALSPCLKLLGSGFISQASQFGIGYGPATRVDFS